MTPLFKKLNFKQQTEVGVFNAPASFDVEVQLMEGTAAFVRDAKKVKKGDFLIAFAATQQELDVLSNMMVSLVANDGIMWFCYPKGTSKKYKCDFNRDTGWHVLGALGFEPVRAVAIDEDWSALRFRKVEHIKTMTRSFALTEEGKKKAAKK